MSTTVDGWGGNHRLTEKRRRGTWIPVPVVAMSSLAMTTKVRLDECRRAFQGRVGAYGNAKWGRGLDANPGLGRSAGLRRVSLLPSSLLLQGCSVLDGKQPSPLATRPRSSAVLPKNRGDGGVEGGWFTVSPSLRSPRRARRDGLGLGRSGQTPRVGLQAGSRGTWLMTTLGLDSTGLFSPAAAGKRQARNPTVV